jgi:hypothetical protein
MILPGGIQVQRWISVINLQVLVAEFIKYFVRFSELRVPKAGRISLEGLLGTIPHQDRAAATGGGDLRGAAATGQERGTCRYQACPDSPNLTGW